MDSIELRGSCCASSAALTHSLVRRGRKEGEVSQWTELQSGERRKAVKVAGGRREGGGRKQRENRETSQIFGASRFWTSEVVQTCVKVVQVISGRKLAPFHHNNCVTGLQGLEVQGCKESNFKGTNRANLVAPCLILRHEGGDSRHFGEPIRRRRRRSQQGRAGWRRRRRSPQATQEVEVGAASAAGGARVLCCAADGGRRRRGGAAPLAGVLPHPGVPLVQDVRRLAARILRLHEQRHGGLWREGRAQLSGKP